MGFQNVVKCRRCGGDVSLDTMGHIATGCPACWPVDLKARIEKLEAELALADLALLMAGRDWVSDKYHADCIGPGMKERKAEEWKAEAHRKYEPCVIGPKQGAHEKPR